MHKKVIKRSVIKKLKYENYKNCFEPTQLDNKINHEEKNKIDTDSLKKDHKVFIKNNKLILKMQKRYGTIKNIVSKKEVNKCGNIIKGYKND